MNGQELILVEKWKEKEKMLNGSSVNGLWSWMREFHRLWNISPHLLIFCRKPWILPEFLECLSEKYNNTSPQNEQGILVLKHVEDLRRKIKDVFLESVFHFLGG